MEKKNTPVFPRTLLVKYIIQKVCHKYQLATLLAKSSPELLLECLSGAVISGRSKG